MGNDRSKFIQKYRDNIRSLGIKLLYMTDHQCKTTTVEDHTKIILSIFKVLDQIPIPTPIHKILDLLRLFIDQTQENGDSQMTLSILLKTVLHDDKIHTIKLDFKTIHEFFKLEYSTITDNQTKITQLHIHKNKIRDHCVFLYDAMMHENNIPIDPIWFYLTGVRIHLLLLQELIRLENLVDGSYDDHLNDYVQKIDQIKLKFIHPNNIQIQRLDKVRSDSNGTYLTIDIWEYIELKSYDGKKYEIGGIHYRLISDNYETYVRDCAQQYYDEQMRKIDTIIEGFRRRDGLNQIAL